MIDRAMLNAIRIRLAQETDEAQYAGRNVVYDVDRARDLLDCLAELDEFKRAEAEDLAVLYTKAERLAERLSGARDTLQTLEGEAQELQELIGKAAEEREVVL